MERSSLIWVCTVCKCQFIRHFGVQNFRTLTVLCLGTTNEKDLPESRTEFNEEYGSIELPSVNRLKAMFGQSKQMDGDSSLRRVGTISIIFYSNCVKEFICLWDK